MIKIKLKCFSQVKYALETDELIFELEDGTTSYEFEKIVRQRSGDKLEGVTLRIAVNQEYVDIDHLVQAGDEIAFFPPVTGG